MAGKGERSRTPRASRRGAPEVIVIGTGAVGAACAAALARRGLPVRVLGLPARSTTTVSGGHLLLQSKRPGRTLELARRSQEILAEFAAGREGELGYQQTGSLLLAADAAEREALRSHFELLRQADVPLEWFESPRSLEPSLASDLPAAVYCPSDAQIDPSALTGAWLHEALSRGAAIVSGARVESFVRSGGTTCGIVASGIEYAARAMVIAAGPWSGELAEMAGARVEIRPRRGILLRGQSEGCLASRPLLGAGYLAAKFGDDAQGVAFSFQQHPNGDWLLGGSREFVEFSEEIPGNLPERIRDLGSRYLPAIRNLKWERIDVGFRPWSARGEPYLGESEVPGVWLACGFEGDGITLAAAAGEVISDSLP